MHNRQGGAAHVNIFFLLFALLLFAGGVFFLYTMITAKGDVEKRLETARADVQPLRGEVLLREHNIEEVAEMLGMASMLASVDGEEKIVPSVYKGRDNISEEDYGSQKLQGVALPSTYNRRMRAALERIGASTSSTKFDDVLSAMNTRLETLRSEAAKRKGDIDTNLAAKSTKDDEILAAKQEHATAVSGVLSTIEQGLAQFRSQSTQNEAQIANLNNGLRQQFDELHTAVNEHVSDRERLEAINARYTDHKNALEAVLAQRNAPETVDGRVLASEAKVDRAYIDLNREDGLLAGTVFKISNPRSRAIKAYGTVVSVGALRSEIAIHGLVDEFDPVAAGDELRNDRFTPGMKRTIYLMGNFQSPWDHGTVAGIFRGLGHTVVRKFDAGVDLVILGDATGSTPLSETEEFQDAAKLGVEFAPVARFRDLLSLRGR